MWRVPLLSKDVRAGLSALLRGGIWVSSSSGFCRGPGRLHLCVCRACCHQPHFGGQREENDNPESPAGRGRTPGTKMKEGRAQTGAAHSGGLRTPRGAPGAGGDLPALPRPAPGGRPSTSVLGRPRWLRCCWSVCPESPLTFTHTQQLLICPSSPRSLYNTEIY